MAGQGQGYTDYRVKLANVGSRSLHVMRFKPPHKCDLEKLVSPTLERQSVKKEGEEAPVAGEGSEYGWRRREEARRRRRGLASRGADPDDKPWVLREQKRGGKHFIGRKEGSVNTSSSYYVFTVGQDGAFEAYPIQNWYDFVPPVKYNYLNADEAEERFERRNKTLNLFSVMLSKKLRGAEGEEEEGGGEGAEGGGAGRAATGGSSKGKGKAQDLGLLLTDSESGDFTSEESEGEGPSKPSQKKDPGKALLQRKRRKKSQTKHSDSEAGEDTDEGEWESREVDYMSDSTSGSEHEYQAKQAMKEAPKDDEELERQEEGDIDKGFTESSSSSEDELTEEGKELKALMSKQGGDTAEPGLEEEEGEAGTAPAKPAKGEESGSRPTMPSKSAKAAKKEEKTKKSSPSKAHKRDRESDQAPNSSQAGDGSNPPSKKHRTESTSTISEEEVRRYLCRKPITSKDLVKKFTSKKTEMDRNKIVEVLGQIIQHMKGVTRQTIKGNLYLSLKLQEQ